VPDRSEKPEAEDLDAEAKLLPDREMPALIDANVVIPVNAAVAANVLSEDSIASASAEQEVDIEQQTDDET
jgi:hypothetical protein